MIEIFKEKVIKFIDSFYITQGVNNNVDFELKLKKGKHSEADYIYVLKYVIDYIIQENAIIIPNQTISFNSWVLKFVYSKDNFLEIHELDPTNLVGCIEGAEFSLEIQKNQIKVCEKYSSKFVFPIINQKIVISDGVLEGNPVEAIRYESPKHMSGWWITTDLYNDDINSLKQIELPELNSKRPDLIQYLALDNGYRFFIDRDIEDVWLDETIE
ncbi:hypothetical protein [Flavobacterium sp. '19STA2R22 D10 B1']|uniref:immunity protein Imm33 domain-containing protein n=1 Tax=Flavobacterium aerium TaxID=3037261 RepID=UPI00278C6D24|nr:hypothetical protein [Flavobacterium sp. '19STA2R22 D10 B1']